jgi:hypothetical protein
MTEYALAIGPGETIADLFRRLFASASLGWIVPVARAPLPRELLSDERLDLALGFTVYEGPPITAELLANLEPGWIACTLSVRVPAGTHLERRTLLRRADILIGMGPPAPIPLPALTPLALLEIRERELVLHIASIARTHPDSALETEKWDLAENAAREELEAILGRLR